MQVEELFDLTTWIDYEIIENEIIQKYQNLQTILAQNIQPNKPKAPFEQQRDELIKALENITLIDLSLGQIEILKEIGIANNVGINGIEQIEDILYKNALDLASASKKIQQIITELDAGKQWSKRIHDDLLRIINTDSISTIKNDVLIRIHFSKNAHISNLTEFKDWGKIWYEIGRGVSIIHNESPENIRIVGASQGSIILSLISTYTVAKTISMIISEALKVIDRIFELRKKAEEIRALKISNDQAEKILLDAAEKQKIEGISSITEKTISASKIKSGKEGDKTNELSNSIKKLFDFIEKGGEIDFVLPDEVDDDQKKDNNKTERELLRKMFKEVRLLENKIKLLEYTTEKEI